MVKWRRNIMRGAEARGESVNAPSTQTMNEFVASVLSNLRQPLPGMHIVVFRDGVMVSRLYDADLKPLIFATGDPVPAAFVLGSGRPEQITIPDLAQIPGGRPILKIRAPEGTVLQETAPRNVGFPDILREGERPQPLFVDNFLIWTFEAVPAGNRFPKTDMVTIRDYEGGDAIRDLEVIGPLTKVNFPGAGAGSGGGGGGGGAYNIPGVIPEPGYGGGGLVREGMPGGGHQDGGGGGYPDGGGGYPDGGGGYPDGGGGGYPDGGGGGYPDGGGGGYPDGGGVPLPPPPAQEAKKGPNVAAFAMIAVGGILTFALLKHGAATRGTGR